MRNNSQFDTQYESGQNQNKVLNVLTQLFYKVDSSAVPPLTGAGQYSGRTYSPYYAVEPVSVPTEAITLSTNTSSYPSRSGKANTYEYKKIADIHMSYLAENDET